MMKNINSLVASVCFFLCIGIQPIVSQVIIEGYAFESGNRGYLNQVFVELYNAETNELISRSRSDRDGKFELTGPAGKILTLKGSKDLFHDVEMEVSTVEKSSGEKAFVKLEMKRAPGYIFDITMAEKRDDENQVVDAIRGALVEVYNNTTREPLMVLEDHPHPDFKIDLEKGNHYTIMIRKEGFLAKRMEAFVDVKGCPGVSDNLTEGNENGTLLANVELEKVYTGKKITLNNIYYDYGKATIRKDATEELRNAATFLLDNPEITVELASHTDARGKANKNQSLSEKRAKNTVEWLLDNSELSANRIVARGYGETNPINKCKDGVDCSEREHAANRRTEFKVLSVAPQKEFKSLEKIKFEENMEDMIAELQNEGQIKVKDESELETYIENKGKEEVTETPQEQETIEVEEEELNETIEVETNTEMAGEPQMVDVTTEKQDRLSEKSELPKLNMLGDFTGYKYVIHFAGEALPTDHELFVTHEDLMVLETNSNNFLYMIGDYASKNYATSGLDVIKKKYPEAYVIGFKNGERTE